MTHTLKQILKEETAWTQSKYLKKSLLINRKGSLLQTTVRRPLRKTDVGGSGVGRSRPCPPQMLMQPWESTRVRSNFEG